MQFFTTVMLVIFYFRSHVTVLRYLTVSFPVLRRPVFRSYKPVDEKLKESVLPDAQPGNVEALLGDSGAAETPATKPDEVVCPAWSNSIVLSRSCNGTSLIRCYFACSFWKVPDGLILVVK